jgi:pyruvate/2-oxoglutarate dehydrogenase complex dihydrolipoamide acyltransferase (E2) component
MPKPIRTPRINNNDDVVRVNAVLVKPGDFVRTGESVAEIETDKANVTVEAEEDSYVLTVAAEAGARVAVGSVLMWMGADATETADAMDAGPSQNGSARPTLKAALLLAQHGLDARQLRPAGSRLRAADIEPSIIRPSGDARQGGSEPEPVAAGTAVPLTAEERGMLRTVEWQRDFAVPGYVEIHYSGAAWDEFAAGFQKAEGLLFSPLLGLMAYQLGRLAPQSPKINATIHKGQRFAYDQVNLGVTVQSGETLFIVTIPNAAGLSAREFSDRLNAAQRAAMKQTLSPDQITGATLVFTSMARWQAARHIPVLAPHTSFILAHSAPAGDGVSVLGATYDHRVLSGADAVRVLQQMKEPDQGLL